VGQKNIMKLKREEQRPGINFNAYRPEGKERGERKCFLGEKKEQEEGAEGRREGKGSFFTNSPGRR